jgi:hypothetical protein
MLILNNVSRKGALLVPLWIQLKGIAHLAEQTSTQMQHATRICPGFLAWRRGMQNVHAWSEQMCPRQSAAERYLLIACMPREGTITISDLIILIIATPMSHRHLFIDCLYGERELCQT